MNTSISISLCTIVRKVAKAWYKAQGRLRESIDFLSSNIKKIGA